MAKRSNGEEGKIILLMRTNADTSTTAGTNKINQELLEYGEPLFNENDNTLQIGGSTATNTTNLKVFQAVSRALKNLFLFIGSKDSTNNFIVMRDAAGTEYYPTIKNWGTFTVPAAATWYNIDTDGKKGSTVISDTTTFPRCLVISISGMNANRIVNVELAPSTTARRNVANMKTEKKNFGFICPGSYTASGSLVLIFSKIPTANFQIRVTGG